MTSETEILLRVKLASSSARFCVHVICFSCCRNQVPAEAEANFLQKAATLDTFGVDPHKVKVSLIIPSYATSYRLLSAIGL